MSEHNLSGPRTFIVMPVEGLSGVLLIELEKEAGLMLPRYFEDPVTMGIHIAAMVSSPKQ